MQKNRPIETRYTEIKADRLSAVETASQITHERNPRSRQIVCNEILDTLNKHDRVSMYINQIIVFSPY